MKVDYQLIVEAETILPKLAGFQDDCHIVQAHLSWYQRACDGTDSPNAMAKMYGDWLTQSVANAKRILAEKSIL